MATLGYWPHNPSGKTPTGGGSKTTTTGGHNTSSAGEGNGTKMLVTEADVANSSTSHNVQGKERME